VTDPTAFAVALVAAGRGTRSRVATGLEGTTAFWGEIPMSTIAALPASLRDKMTSLSRRIRLLRAVRGTSLLLLVLLFLGGCALLADYAFNLPPLSVPGDSVCC